MTGLLLRRTLRLVLAAFVLSGASLIAAGSAKAQFFAYGFRYGPAPIVLPGPYFPGSAHRFADDELDIVGDLRERGYSRIGVVQRRGDVVIVDAVSPRRQEVRLIVDAYDGEILQRFAYAREPARKVAALRDPAARRSEPVKADPAKKEAPRREPLAREPIKPLAQPASPPVAAAPPPPPRRPAAIVPNNVPNIGATQALQGRRFSDWAPINSVPVAPLD
jgi:hypothetical protein